MQFYIISTVFIRFLLVFYMCPNDPNALSQLGNMGNIGTLYQRLVEVIKWSLALMTRPYVYSHNMFGSCVIVE